PERDDLRRQHFPGAARARQQQLVCAFGTLRRHDIAAEDGDEKREEKEARHVRETADEERRGWAVGLEVVVEIKLQTIDLRAHRSRPRLVDATSPQGVLI